MTDLLKHVELSIRDRKLFRRGDRILVAVSGGVDSMVLLHLLHALAGKHRWTLIVAHFNHCLRGRASDADERFVLTTAKKLRLLDVISRGDVKASAKENGASIEMAGRLFRHKFFVLAAGSCKASVVALAHHADDQVELFFLRLLRGAGGEGVAGMKWRSHSPADANVQIVRPLLDVNRVDLEQFARENKIRFREDASNASREILRNRIRHELLPLLRERFQPALNKTVLRLMDIVGGESEFVEAAARRWLKTPRPSFDRLALPLARRVLQLQLRDRSVAADFDLIESLRVWPNKPVTFGPERTAVRDAAGRVSLRAVSSAKFSVSRLAVKLRGRAGETGFGGAQFRWRLARQTGRELASRGRGHEVFDADRIGTHVVLRHWRPGDRFQPIGMAAPVKLQDCFTNRKIPRDRRRELVLATTERGEIFWVEDLRIGEHFKLTARTKKCLIWGWKRG